MSQVSQHFLRIFFFISDSTFWFAHLFKNDEEEKKTIILDIRHCVVFVYVYETPMQILSKIWTSSREKKPEK